MHSVKDKLHQIIETMPDNDALELIEYIDFMKRKRQQSVLKTLNWPVKPVLAFGTMNATTRPGIMYNQGDILLIPIPFSDLKTNKKRPVLVLSNSDYNSNNQDIVVAAITSNLEQKEYSITITSDDLDEGELKYESVIRADKIYSLSQAIVLKKFGAVKKEVMKLTNSEINRLINVNN